MKATYRYVNYLFLGAALVASSVIVTNAKAAEATTELDSEAND